MIGSVFQFSFLDELSWDVLLLQFQYFGVKEDQVPIIIIQTTDGKKYIKAHLEPDQIASWLKDFKVIILFHLTS